MRPVPAVIPKARFEALCGALALRQVLGIVTVLGTLAWMRPATVAAQAIGTMQVGARVIAADSEWSSLQAAQRIAADLSSVSSDAPMPSRVTLPLSEIQWVTRSGTAGGEVRPALISVQYLRN
jgi:hypothetical protein